MHLFHCPDLLGASVELPEEEAHHATAVLRLAVGTRIGLLDGAGTKAAGEIESASKKGCTVRILERVVLPAERSARIHLAVAPTKQMDRYEWFVEKAVEIGVDRITPLITDRTERGKLRIDRLQRVAISAMKQSQRAWLPRIDELTTVKHLLQEDLAPQRLFGWCEGEHRSLMERYTPSIDTVVLIGPEGDFTPEEAATFRNTGFHAVSIGAARLRTETAALAVCTWISLAQQR
ncbi:MAG: 16S rRNA (uracil(1498)-N(3))-methyltransferase [Flavobacteriales bacterium]|nr:16S rRNA (uracil(1498)-N(3))-methyltransferase [Flavobacteriales bacterium]